MKLKFFHGILENKLRTYLILFGIAVCFITIITVDGMLEYMVMERNNELQRFENIVLMQSYNSNYPPVRNIIKEESVVPSLKVSSVNQEKSSPLLFLPLSPPDNPMDSAGIMGIGIKPGCEDIWIGSTEVSSGKKTLMSENDNSIILGQKAATFFGVTTSGGEVFFAGEKWHVSGILKSSKKVFLIDTDHLVIMSIKKAQSAFNMEGMISAMLIVPNNASATKVSSLLSSEYPNLEISSQEVLKQAMNKQLELPIKFLGFVSIAAFFIVIMIIISILIIRIQERIQKPETIISIGIKHSEIIKHTLIEAMILCMLGGIIGIIAAMPTAYLLGWPWILTFTEILRVIVMILLSGLLAAVYPCYQAIKTYTKALRYNDLEKEMKKIGAEKRSIGKAFHNLIKAREEEREHLSHELHDQAIQSLIGLKFTIAQQDTTSQRPLQNEINSIIDMLRGICTNLRPPALDRLGLCAVLTSYAENFSLRNDVSVIFNSSNNTKRMSPEIELSLFRIVQEALNNIRKHAKASNVKIDLSFLSEQVELIICDNGEGFIVPELLGVLIEEDHFGLVNMQERASAVGGKLTLKSDLGFGTCIKVYIPYY